MKNISLVALTAVLVASAAVPALADWNRVGSVKFNGGGAQDFPVPAANAHGLALVGLRPTNDDARCTHVTATFANGETKELKMNSAMSDSSSGNGLLLPRGQVTTVDVPADQDMTRMQLNCHAQTGVRVTIDVLANS